MIRWLLKLGADPNIHAIANTPSGQERKGCLHYAASKGDEYYQTLMALLEPEQGRIVADLDNKNSDG